MDGCFQVNFFLSLFFCYNTTPSSAMGSAKDEGVYLFSRGNFAVLFTFYTPLCNSVAPHGLKKCVISLDSPKRERDGEPK